MDNATITDQDIELRIAEIEYFETGETAGFDTEQAAIAEEMRHFIPTVEQVRGAMQKAGDLDHAIDIVAMNVAADLFEAYAYPKGRLPHENSYQLNTDAFSIGAVFREDA